MTKVGRKLSDYHYNIHLKLFNTTYPHTSNRTQQPNNNNSIPKNIEFSNLQKHRGNKDLK